MTWLLLAGVWVCGGVFVWLLVAGGARPEPFRFLPESEVWRLSELA